MGEAICAAKMYDVLLLYWLQQILCTLYEANYSAAVV